MFLTSSESLDEVEAAYREYLHASSSDFAPPTLDAELRNEKEEPGAGGETPAVVLLMEDVEPLPVVWAGTEDHRATEAMVEAMGSEDLADHIDRLLARGSRNRDEMREEMDALRRNVGELQHHAAEWKR